MILKSVKFYDLDLPFCDFSTDCTNGKREVVCLELFPSILSKSK